MLLADLRSTVAHYARQMATSGLVRATQGNISARDPQSGLICITPTGADYETLGAKDIAVVNEHGDFVEGDWQPSSETPLHTLVLRKRRDINCVMHTHSLYASAFAVTYQRMPIVLAEAGACLGKEIPIVPFSISGTQQFAQQVVEMLGDAPAILWGNHGAMVTGVTVPLTYSTAHALEDNARIYAIAKQLGNPTILPDEDIETLHQHWQQNYHQATHTTQDK